MKSSPYIAGLLMLALTVPTLARGGGGGGGRGGRGGDAGFGMEFGGRGGQQGGFGAGNQGGFGMDMGAMGGMGRGGQMGGFGMDMGGGSPGGGRQQQQRGQQGGRQPGGGSGRIPTFQNEYDILATLSIFDQNRRIIDPYAPPEPPVEDTRPVQIVATGPAPVFIGAAEDDHGFLAFLEFPSYAGNGTVVPVRAGDVISWNNAKIENVDINKLTFVMGARDPLTIPLGFNLNNQEIQMTSAANYVNPDTLAAQQQAQNQQGRGGRGGQQQQGGGGGRGGSMAMGLGGGGGGITNIVPLDPPLPFGSADAIEGRMALRRQQQLNAVGASLSPTFDPSSAVPGLVTPGVITPGVVTPGVVTPGTTTPGATTPGATRPPANAPAVTVPPNPATPVTPRGG